MNREIRFRAWDKKNNHLWDWNYILKQKENLIYWLKTKLKGENRFIPQQYAGLKDKNGKEIYEGDILEKICNDGIKLHYVAEIGISKDNRYGFILRYIDNDKDCIALLIELKELEIIGNIYENPELLKEK